MFAHSISKQQEYEKCLYGISQAMSNGSSRVFVSLLLWKSRNRMTILASFQRQRLPQPRCLNDRWDCSWSLSKVSRERDLWKCKTIRPFFHVFIQTSAKWSKWSRPPDITTSVYFESHMRIRIKIVSRRRVAISETQYYLKSITRTRPFETDYEKVFIYPHGHKWALSLNKVLYGFEL